jgi:D-alanyl-D-alanine carboxypeptidase
MRISLRGALVAAALSTVSIPAPALAAPPADLRERADALLAEAFAADGPGAAVIITDDGETVYAGGRGLADVEARTPITPQTVFRVGSITKQFTAAVVLQLVDEGRISLDDPVSRFLPDYPQPGAGATVRQLLNHTVGIQPYTAIPGFMVEANTNRPYTTEQMIALFRDLPAPSRPGERFAYNNSGYVLLGAIVESVTGMPWHQAVEQRIARPLGLQTLRYGVGEAEMPRMARGYTSGEQGVRPANRIHMSVPHAAGGLIASVEDMARWAQALHHGRVVSAQSYARMIAPTVMADGTTVPYAFGLSNSDIRGRHAIEHGGGIFGFSTDSLYIPEEDLFIAVFTNSDEPNAAPGLVMRRLAAMAVGDPYPEFEARPFEASALEPFFGVYALPNDEGQRRFFARDGKLYTHRSGGSELEAFSAGDGRFFYGDASLTWFQLSRDSSGTPVMEMHQNGENVIERTLHSGPIPSPPVAFAVPRAVLESYVGRYTLPRGPVVVAWGEGDKLTVQLGGQPSRGLRATSETEFAVEGVDGAQVSFNRDNGVVTHVVIQQGERRMAAPRETAAPPAS